MDYYSAAEPEMGDSPPWKWLHAVRLASGVPGASAVCGFPYRAGQLIADDWLTQQQAIQCPRCAEEIGASARREPGR
jgi:hypothetical protein